MTEEEKDHELKRLRGENERLTSERRHADSQWRADTSAKISGMRKGITGIDKKMDRFIRKSEEQDKRLEEHHASLYGTKDAPDTGVILRTASLEQQAKHAAKIYWLIVSFIVTTVGGAIVAAIIYLPKG